MKLPFESVKKFVLLDHEFSLGAGEVTPTLKLRRRVVTERYRKELERLYEEGAAQVGGGGAPPQGNTPGVSA